MWKRAYMSWVNSFPLSIDSSVVPTSSLQESIVLSERSYSLHQAIGDAAADFFVGGHNIARAECQLKWVGGRPSNQSF